MKKNYLLSALFSILTLGAWAADTNVSFETATAVAAGEHSITYARVELTGANAGEYVQHWYKYTATAEEYVFIEDAVGITLESKGTLSAAWPSSDWSEEMIRGGAFDESASYSGTTLYTKMSAGQTLTFYLAAPNNVDEIDGEGNVVKGGAAKDEPSTFKVLSFNTTTYPVAFERNNAVELPVGTPKYVFPVEEDFWFKITPTETGRVVLQRASESDILLTPWMINVYDGEGDEEGVGYREDQSKGRGVYTFIAEAGHTYYLSFSHSRRTQIKWTLEPVAIGADCNLPKKIEDTNNIAIKNGTIFYKYTAKNDGYLELKSTSSVLGDGKPSAMSYDYCGSESVTESVETKDGFYLRRAVTAGDDVIIEVIGSKDGTFSLTETAAETYWDEAHAAVINDITKPVSFPLQAHADKYWFKFKSPADAYGKEYVIKTTNTKGLPERVRSMRLAVTYDKGGNPFTPTAVVDSVMVRLENSTDYYIYVEFYEAAYSTEPSKTTFSYDAPGSYEFKFISSDVKDGHYCDQPIQLSWSDINNVSEFYVGTAVGETGAAISASRYPNENPGIEYAQDFYYQFTAEADGYVGFMMGDNWGDHWLASTKQECGDRLTKLDIQQGEGYIYCQMPVAAGETYIWVPQVYSTTEPILIMPYFAPAQAGEICALPIECTLEVAESIEHPKKDVEIWYSFTASQAGLYNITSNVGKGGTLKYIVGDCGGKSSNWSKDYATGAVNAYIYLKQDSKILMSYKWSTWDDETSGVYELKVSKSDLKGTVSLDPMNAVSGQTYVIPTDNAYANGAWYAYTATSAETDIVAASKYSFQATSMIAIYAGTEVTENKVTYTTPAAGTVTEIDGKFYATHTFATTPGTTYLIQFKSILFGIGAKGTVTGNDVLPLNDAVMVYPNPNNGEFIVALGDIESIAKIEVLDLSGKTIYSVAATSASETVNLQGIVSGTYFVKVTTNGATVVKKVMITK